MARGGGDEAAGLGEQGDQRGLAEEGRLAAHVGAGDQPQPVVSAERAIVGDEALARCRQRLLDHRMAAALDLEAGLVGRACGRHQPPSAARSAWLGGDVDPGDARRRSAAIARRGARRRARSVPRDARPRRRARGRRPRRPAPPRSCRSGELKRTTPARVWRWVKPLIRRHQPVGVPGRHLDMIAEHGIVADLERRDRRSPRDSAPRARRSRGGRRRRSTRSASSAAS